LISSADSSKLAVGMYSTEGYRQSWGFTTGRGDPMARSTIYSLSSSAFYHGVYEYPKASDSWYTGRHTPMITDEEFNTVQHCYPVPGRCRANEPGIFLDGEFAWNAFRPFGRSKILVGVALAGSFFSNRARFANYSAVGAVAFAAREECQKSAFRSIAGLLSEMSSVSRLMKIVGIISQIHAR
jgi:hypothetical protein